MSYVKSNARPTGRTKGASSGFDLVGGIPFPEDRSVRRFDGDDLLGASGAGAPWEAPIAYVNPADYQSYYTYSGPYVGNVTQGVNYQGSSGGGGSAATNQDKLESVTGATTLNPPKTAEELRKNAVNKALRALAEAVASARAFDKGASGLTTEQKQQAVTDARGELEKLGVTRDEIEAYNTDTFGGLPNAPLSPRLGKGNIVDTAKDFLADATQAVYEAGDWTGEALGSVLGIGDPDQYGPTVPNLGVGWQWGATGKQTPVRIGTAKDGTPIVVYMPGGGFLEGATGAAQQGGGLWDIVKGGVAGAGGLGGIATTAATTAALNAVDNQDNKDKATTKGGVLLNPGPLDNESISGETGVIDTGQVKTTGVDTNTGGAGTDTILTGGAGTDTTLISDTEIFPQTDVTKLIKEAPSVSFDRPRTIKQASVSFDRPFADITGEETKKFTDITGKGSEPYEAWLEETVETQKTAEKTGGGGAAGGSGLPAGGGGIAEIAGEPGELVDIDYLFDVGGDSIFAPEILEEDEDELLYPYSGGGAVKRFSGTAGSAVSAYPPASLVPEEDGGTMKTGKNIFQKGLPALIGAGLGAAFGLIDEDDPNPSGYQGGIPEYKYKRSLVSDPFSTTNADGTPRRPGSAGRSYFTEGAYDPIMETVDGVEVQKTLGGAQRRADAVAAAAQAKEDEDYIAQIGQDFLDLQPVDDTATAGSAETADAGTGSVVDAGAADAAGAAGGEDTSTQSFFFDAAGNKYLDNPAYKNSTVASYLADGTFTVAEMGDIQNLLNASSVDGQAMIMDTFDAFDPDFKTGFQNYLDSLTTDTTTKDDTTDGFSAYDTVLDQYDPNATEYDSTDINTVIKAITDNTVGTRDVAEDFGISESEVWGNLLRQGAYTPAGLASYIATNSNQPDYTEEDLIVRLLTDGQTTVEEVAEYYQTRFPGITPQQISANLAAYKPAPALAHGGMLHGDGYYLGGTTDGMADQVPATIGGQEPARLSDGEFVVPADVVSHLGNGNSDAGATQLYSMMDRVRKKRTGTTQQGAEINPMQQLPA